MAGIAAGALARTAVGARGLVLVASLALAATVGAAEPDQVLAVGAQAPALVLGDQHGTTFRLVDALGANRYVVLAFYPKAFTGG